MNTPSSINELNKAISELPVGYISKKNINGKVCYYRQWKEDGKLKSKYIPDSQVDYVASLINSRKKLELKLQIELLRSKDDSASKNRLYEYSQRLQLGYTIPIGEQNYDTLITNQEFYIDKTQLIKEWWEHGDSVTLITRPRRFGKTLNISMLKCFFSNQYANRSDLFEAQAIWQYDSYRDLQGTFPVIHLSFGAIKSKSFKEQLEMFKLEITSLFLSFQYLRDMISDKEKEVFDSISWNMSDTMAIRSINILSQILFRIYGKKVIILLDEYDTPVLELYSSADLRDSIQFMRQFFNATFKTNTFLEKALLTGITRISRESFFSDLNHLNIASVTSSDYATYFGFTYDEVTRAMKAQHMTDIDGVRDWYDGFCIGNQSDIYNPWSIINYLRHKRFEAYWVHSSSNKLISTLFQQGNREIKYALEDLINGEHIYTEINEELIFDNLSNNETALWSLLVASGYLKITGIDNASGQSVYELTVTNREVAEMLRILTHEWFAPARSHYSDFLKALMTDDVDYMITFLRKLSKEIFSYFDTSYSCDEPERFYHGFILGLIVDLKDRYIIRSNRESGLGRYDVMLIPLNPVSDHAIIMEFKVYNILKDTSLEDAAKNALTQINVRAYDTDLIAQGINPKNIYRYGVAFKGKDVWIAQ